MVKWNIVPKQYLVHIWAYIRKLFSIGKVNVCVTVKEDRGSTTCVHSNSKVVNKWK